MNDSEKLDWIMKKMGYCPYPEPGHICHQCSENPPIGWCYGKEWHERESKHDGRGYRMAKPCGPDCEVVFVGSVG